MRTTPRMKASDISKDWHVIDAAGRPLGRVATEAATLLRGKHKPTFEPHLDGGDFVIIVNASRVKVTGNKANTMIYYRHSGYPGGLKSRTFEEQMERFPDRVIERAVHGMLPKGSLGQQMRKHLKVYAGPEHPHQAQIAGSDKARARREEAAANGEFMPRVMPKLSRLKLEAATEDEEPATGGEVREEIVSEAAPIARAPEPSAGAAETVAAEPAVAAAAPEAETTAEDAPRPRRRRASKTEAAEDSEE